MSSGGASASASASALAAELVLSEINGKVKIPTMATEYSKLFSFIRAIIVTCAKKEVPQAIVFDVVEEITTNLHISLFLVTYFGSRLNTLRFVNSISDIAYSTDSEESKVAKITAIMKVELKKAMNGGSVLSVAGGSGGGGASATAGGSPANVGFTAADSKYLSEFKADTAKVSVKFNGDVKAMFMFCKVLIKKFFDKVPGATNPANTEKIVELWFPEIIQLIQSKGIYVAEPGKDAACGASCFVIPEGAGFIYGVCKAALDLRDENKTVFDNFFYSFSKDAIIATKELIKRKQIITGSGASDAEAELFKLVAATNKVPKKKVSAKTASGKAALASGAASLQANVAPNAGTRNATRNAGTRNATRNAGTRNATRNANVVRANRMAAEGAEAAAVAAAAEAEAVAAEAVAAEAVAAEAVAAEAVAAPAVVAEPVALETNEALRAERNSHNNKGFVPVPPAFKQGASGANLLAYLHSLAPNKPEQVTSGAQFLQILRTGNGKSPVLHSAGGGAAAGGAGSASATTALSPSATAPNDELALPTRNPSPIYTLPIIHQKCMTFIQLLNNDLYLEDNLRALRTIITLYPLVNESEVRERVFHFYVVGGNAASIHMNQIMSFGDWDCVLLINPNLPDVLFESVKSYCKTRVYYTYFKFLTQFNHTEVFSEYESVGLTRDTKQISNPFGGYEFLENHFKTIAEQVPFEFTFVDKMNERAGKQVGLSLFQMKSRTARRITDGKFVSEFLVDIAMPLKNNPMIMFLWLTKGVSMMDVEYEGAIFQLPVLDLVSLIVEQKRSSESNVETRPHKITRRLHRAKVLTKKALNRRSNRALNARITAMKNSNPVIKKYLTGL